MPFKLMPFSHEAFSALLRVKIKKRTFYLWSIPIGPQYVRNAAAHIQLDNRASEDEYSTTKALESSSKSFNLCNSC